MSSCSREMWYQQCSVLYVSSPSSVLFPPLTLECLPSRPPHLQHTTCTRAAGRAWSSSWERHLSSQRQSKVDPDFLCSMMMNPSCTNVIHRSLSCLYVVLCHSTAKQTVNAQLHVTIVILANEGSFELLYTAIYSFT